MMLATFQGENKNS